MVAFSERDPELQTGITRQQTRGILIGLVFTAGVLCPPIPLGYGLPDVRLDEILLLLFVLGSLFQFPFVDLRAKHHRTTTLIFGLFALSITLSTVYASIFLKYRFNPRDLTEYFTLGLYGLAFVLAANWQKIGKDSLKRLGMVALAATYLIVLFGFAQLYNWAEINTWLTPRYTALIQMEGLIGGLHRTVGTFGNPNVWGFFMMMVLTFQVAWMYHQTLNFRSWKLYAQLGLLFLGLMALFMTLSRAAVLVMGIVLVYLSLSKLLRKRWSLEALGITLLIFLVTVGALFAAPQSFLFRMAEGAHFGTSSSVAGRIEQWGTAWVLIRQSPIFGWGTAKGFLTTIVDNEYILIWRRYGLIGLSIFITLWVHLARYAFQLLRREHEPVPQTLGQAALAISIGIIIFDLSSGIFYNLQVMPVYLLMMGTVRSWLTFKEAKW
jgi:O-antigen ligase